jgi:hypothetical protein
MTPLKSARSIIFVIVLLAVSNARLLPSSRSQQNVYRIDSGGSICYLKISPVEFVSGDQILDEYGNLVTWRGAGGSYLFHAGERYKEAWQLHLPQIQAMGLNTIRLAFAFADSPPVPQYGVPASDILDFDKLDWVLGFLDQHGIKGILDLHIGNETFGDGEYALFGSQRLIDDWVALSRRYVDDSRIAAYELWNEPGPYSWDPSVTSTRDVIRAYANLTDAVRVVDPRHIVIWQSFRYLVGAQYTHKLAEFVQPYLRPNVVFTAHYWNHKDSSFESYTPCEVSYLNLDTLVRARSELKAPFWLGEFGSHVPFDYTNPEFQWAEQAAFRCEEQGLGWNLWMGRTGIDHLWVEYLPMFPLKIFDVNSSRNPWIMPLPSLIDYIVEEDHLDELTVERASMYHNNDWVVLAPGITVLVEVEHKLADGTFETASRQEIVVVGQLKISNVEGTSDQPGDRNTHIYLVKS